MSAKNPNPSRHERSDLPPLPFLLVAAGLALVIGGALFGLRYLTVGFESVRASLAPPPPAVADHPPPPASPPLLLSDAPRRRLEAQGRRALATYARADQGDGTVAIPIDRAMRIVAERGEPDWRNETDWRAEAWRYSPSPNPGEGSP